jgi:hypothetical protein
MVSPGETSIDVVIDAQRESVLLRNTARAAAAAATTSRRGPGGGGDDEAQWESGSFDYKRAPARSPGVRESTPTSKAAAWSRSRSAPNSKTFRDSLKRSVLKVKELSQELVRLPTRKAGPSSPTVRIEDIDSSSAAAPHDPLVDSELGLVDDDGAFDPRRSRLGPSSLAPAAGNKKKALVARTDSTGAGFALEGLRFITQATAATEEGRNKLWEAVEARFHSLAVSPDNQLQQLPRSKFPECIGMKDSKEFATELYDVLVRRKGGSAEGGSLSVQESISIDELHEFWLDITDNSFDTRMAIFFDM